MELDNTENKLLSAIDYLYLTIGIYQPTEQQRQWVIESIVYVNIDNWVNNPKTSKEYLKKVKFIRKSLLYYYRKSEHKIPCLFGL